VDLADELRLAPDGEARLRAARGADVEGAVGALELAELPGQPVDQLLREARPDPAGEMELLRPPTLHLGRRRVVVADQHPADPVRAAPPSRDVAPDHELLVPPDTLLDPLPGSPAGAIGAVAALGDDSLEALQPRRLQQPGAAAVAVAGRPPAGALEPEPVEQL